VWELNLAKRLEKHFVCDKSGGGAYWYVPGVSAASTPLSSKKGTPWMVLTSTENGSSQGQNLALTGLFVPSWLDSGFTHLARTACTGVPRS